MLGTYEIKNIGLNGRTKVRKTKIIKKFGYKIIIGPKKNKKWATRWPKKINFVKLKKSNIHLT